MPWSFVDDDRKVIDQIKDCGFNVAGFVSADALATCRKAGIKGILVDSRIGSLDWAHLDEAAVRAPAIKAIKAARKNPALYGYFLGDEPGSDSFAGLALLSSLVRQNAPGKRPYINLFPDYADPGQLGAASYEEYLERFVTTCHPTQLSYDHYALLDTGGIGPNYWNNLEQIRTVAKRHDLPFWNIVLAVAHFAFREPTASDLRFEVFSSLAYGSRGMAYFAYLAPKVGNYRAAAIDQFGHSTPTYGLLQNINLQIQHLAPTLLELRSDDTYHFGTVPAGCRGPGPNSLVLSVRGEIAVGEFTHTDGSRYVMLVNRDLLKSIPCEPQFRHPPKLVKFVSPYTGELLDYVGEQRWLAPGQGVLLKVTD